MGWFSTKEECEKQVRIREPTASGLTYGIGGLFVKHGLGLCIADFGNLTGIRHDDHFLTCTFEQGIF